MDEIKNFDDLPDGVVVPRRLTAAAPSEKSAIWWCFHRRHHLTLRNRQFIENLTDRHKPLSPKQQKWLCDIREKLERGAAA